MQQFGLKQPECIVYLEAYRKVGDGIVDAYIDFRQMKDIESENPCGVCVPAKSVEELRNAIVDLLGNQMKAAALGANARKRVNEQYAMPKVWEQLV